MSKTLRVVVPPHPLIGHWLTLLRDQQTPPALFTTGMAELGRWLTYEALRDWLPQRRVMVETPLASSEGTVVDGAVPMLAIPLLRAGLGLWDGARPVVPQAQVAHVDSHGDGLPASIPTNTGVLVFAPAVATGAELLNVLERLESKGVSGPRLRVISALTASPGLKTLGERYGDLTIYTACIDAELDASQRIVPGLGDVAARLYGFASQSSVG
jgi:uracil phosphoribosyltransferase